MRRAQAQTISFEALDSTSSTGELKSGVAFLTTDVQISKDGAAFADVGAAPTEIGSSGVYALTLTAAETNCSWLVIKALKSGMRPRILGGAMDPQPAAAVVDDAANSATTFVTNLPEDVDDFWAGAGVVFTSGALRGQVREIASYDGDTKAITLDVQLTDEPAAGALFVLING
jgi:hypothetical protein